jgi:hypothetical protein
VQRVMQRNNEKIKSGNRHNRKYKRIMIEKLKKLRRD